MSIHSISSFLSKLQQSLTLQESPEMQFLHVDLYKSDNFNLKSFSLSIFDKIKDTTYLLSQLKLQIEKSKSEIVDQINSNFNNYVTLISKLQTIDFLIDNINSSLDNIKKKLNAKIELIVKYESELNQMVKFIEDNDNEIQNVKDMLHGYENKLKCEKLIEKNEMFLKENNTSIEERDYTVIRKMLFLFINFFHIKMKCVSIDTREINNSAIDTAAFKYNDIIKGVLEHTLKNYFSNKQQNKIQLRLNLNILSLINKIYTLQSKDRELYEKIYDEYVKKEINAIFEKNAPVGKKISEIDTLMKDEKYSKLNIEFNNILFGQICFLLPFISEFSNDKFLSNCTDSIQFKDNYISILRLISNFSIDNILTEIRNFIQMFSFVTYFRYVQNDISLQLIPLAEIEEHSKYTISIIEVNNCIFNYLNAIEDIFNGGKIFLMNIQDFLYFIIQCSNFIKDKVDIIERDNELIKIYNNKKNEASNEEIKFEIDKKEVKDIENFYTAMKRIKEYFAIGGEFNKGIKKIAQREMFICKEESERKEIESELDELCECIAEFYTSK